MMFSELFAGKKSIYMKRCDDIEAQLEKHDITANVYRHTLFGEKYYIIGQVDKEQHWNEVDICKALDIPRDWVDLYCYRSGLIASYVVNEKKLHDLYANKNSRLNFNKKKKNISFEDSTEDMFDICDYLGDD